jgi:CxxC motif-containing protein
VTQDLTVIPFALSPKGCEMMEYLLSEHVDEHARWVEANECERGDEADVALAAKILAELRVAKSHAEPVPPRATDEPTPRKRTTTPKASVAPTVDAAAVADKMAKAARKAVDDHEERQG